MPLPRLSKADLEHSHQFAVHPNIPKQHRTLLHSAVKNNHQALVQQLLEQHQVPIRQDYWGRTPLHLAEIFSLSQISDVLKVYGGSTNDLRDGFGRTAEDIRRWKDTTHQVAIEPRVSNGTQGWSDTTIELDSSVQQIDEVNYGECTFQELIRSYISCLKPVIIRGCPEVERLQEQWTRSFIEREYGGLSVEVGDIPYGKSLGRTSRMSTLKEHLSNGSSYAFFQLNPQHHASLMNGLPSISLFSKFPTVFHQFYQGGKGTGAPMHMHVDALNVLVHGQKRWRISPPFQGVYSATPVQKESTGQEWHTREFIQYPGDIVYIPKYWAHEIYNLRENIGFATEFLNPYAV